MLQRRVSPALGVRIDPDDILNEAFFDARRKWAAYKEHPQLSEYAWL